MKVLIVGAGKVGKYLAEALSANHTVILLDVLEEKSRLFEENTSVKVHIGDGCEPLVLESAGAGKVDAIVAATGDDEDNLVISLLGKNQFKIKKVVARVNNPRNHWLFSKRWGVDVAISSPHIIHQLLEEELSLGDIVTLMKLKEGKVSLVELTIADGSTVDGKMIKDLNLPEDSIITVHMRDDNITIPQGETQLQTGDDLLIVTNPKHEKLLSEIFSEK
jgi:trk system potassium uptake protein TrkA